MKKTFTYLFVVILSAMVFYGGAGINVISYCCIDCRSAGIEAIASHHHACCETQCCENHGDHKQYHDKKACESACESSIEHSHKDCCGIERLQYDWSTASELDIDLEPVTIDLLFAELSNISILSVFTLEEISAIMPTGPPIDPPRAYLSLLTTLLI